MTEQEAQAFVERFAAAWATKDGAAFLRLWHPEGQLHYPFASRVIRGDEIGKLNDLTRQNTPALTWKLLSWTHRGTSSPWSGRAQTVTASASSPGVGSTS